MENQNPLPQQSRVKQGKQDSNTGGDWGTHGGDAKQFLLDQFEFSNEHRQVVLQAREKIQKRNAHKISIKLTQTNALILWKASGTEDV